ncbi:MAG: TldD/PmbA family protein [Chloroflexi bacterium]|nr:TldD/PmbA family protein [Chloroflexota bacterium]
MLGEQRIREITHGILAQSRADQTEVSVIGGDSQLTRFANNAIHQHVAEVDVQVRVRVVSGKRLGAASTNDVSREALERTLEMALTTARLQPENPDFRSLPSPLPLPPLRAFSEATASCTPEQRARAVALICGPAAEARLSAAGALETSIEEYAVANSLGVFGYFPTTLADLRTVIMGQAPEGGSGYAAAAALDIEEIDAQAIGREAIHKALRSRNPIDIEPGPHVVILEEYAVDDLVGYLSYLGFGALAVQEKRSFMVEKRGQPVASPWVSLWDDGRDPRGLPMPFDFEGVPKQKVELITRGIAREVVYDSYTAGREAGKSSTGHALPAPNPSGPFAWNLFMTEGDASRDELLTSIERGIWVTRLHYVRPVHPLKTIVTGMTRDGTFLIEHGELTRPVKNLRFTQSILEALAKVSRVGREIKVGRSFLEDFLGAISVPALRIEEFNFTGTTEF